MKKINFIILVLWCIFIFSFSNQDANTSDVTSYEFADQVIEKYETVTNNEVDKETFIEKNMKLIRKTAHFSLYLVLGFLSINFIKDYKISRKMLLGVLFCFLYACSDEIHQLFLDGRSGQLSDVLLDTSGAIIGIFIYYITYVKLLKKSLI